MSAADDNGGTVPMGEQRGGSTRHADGGTIRDRGHYHLPNNYFKGKLVYEHYSI